MTKIIELVNDDLYESWTDNSVKHLNHIHFIDRWMTVILTDDDLEELYQHIRKMRKALDKLA